MTTMTSAIIHGTDMGDQRTHIERLDAIDTYSHELREDDMPETVKDVRDAEAAKTVGDTRQALPPTEWAHDDHPLGLLWPYRTTLKSISREQLPVPPGTVVDLLPHEVGRFHTLARDVVDARARGDLPTPMTPDEAKAKAEEDAKAKLAADAQAKADEAAMAEANAKAAEEARLQAEADAKALAPQPAAPPQPPAEPAPPAPETPPQV
jgi:hypothetical protein